MLTLFHTPQSQFPPPGAFPAYSSGRAFHTGALCELGQVVLRGGVRPGSLPQRSLCFVQSFMFDLLDVRIRRTQGGGSGRGAL